MRYAFVSDLHANLQAWRAVHLDIRASRADYIICLGDVIGYGPSPAELLGEVHRQVDAFVLGNHDAAVCGRLDDSSFTPHAQRLIRWTAARLNRKACAFLRTLPLSITGNGFRCAHGEFSDPARFEYVLNAEEALASWRATDAPLLFAGHTHEPALFLLGDSGIPRQAGIQDFEIEPGKRYFINIGSVGHPRDGDPRASYCLYDTAARAVFWRRIPFDLAAHRDALAEAGLDATACHFLKQDPTTHLPPLREQLDFAPPRTPAKAARGAPVAQEFSSLLKAVRRWRLLSLAALASLCLLGLASLGLSRPWQASTRAPRPAALRNTGGTGSFRDDTRSRSPRVRKSARQKRIMKPDKPLTGPGSTTTRSTREAAEPLWHHSMKASTTGASASASIRTEPSSSLRTEPAMPSEAATERTDHRKPTP